MNHCAIAAENQDNPTWSPAWRLECEARYLLGLPLRIRQEGLKHPSRALRRVALEAVMRKLFDAQRRVSA